MSRNYRTFINSSCIRYHKLCQSYPQINTGEYTKTSLGRIDRPDGLVHQQHQTGWKASSVFEQLATDHTRPMGLAGHIRVLRIELTQTPWQTKPMPEIKRSKEEQEKISQRVQELMAKGAIVETILSKNNFVSQIFAEGRGQKPVINLKSLNTFVRTKNFKMEGCISFQTSSKHKIG